MFNYQTRGEPGFSEWGLLERPHRVRPEEPMAEARRADSGGEVFGEGAASPVPTS